MRVCKRFPTRIGAGVGFTIVGAGAQSPRWRAVRFDHPDLERLLRLLGRSFEHGLQHRTVSLGETHETDMATSTATGSLWTKHRVVAPVAGVAAANVRCGSSARGTPQRVTNRLTLARSVDSHSSCG
jgi:hypothetical protein